MKSLHRPDLFSWSIFDTARNIDFNGYAWIRDAGRSNVLFDPVSMSEHDLRHLQELGGARWIVVTNSDHVRDAAILGETLGARIVGPRGESERFPIACDDWLSEGDTRFGPDLAVFEMRGSKTAGELAFILGDSTLITGDLIRSHRAGSLMLLPDSKLTDPERARESVRELSTKTIGNVLVGDGWSAFGNGGELLHALVRTFASRASVP